MHKNSIPNAHPILPDLESLSEWSPRQTDLSMAWLAGDDVRQTPTDALLDEMAALRTIRGWHRIEQMIGQHRPAPLPAWISCRLEAIGEELESRGARTLTDRAFSVPNTAPKPQRPKLSGVVEL